MGFEHNLMAHQVSALLLQQIRTGNAAWSHPRLTTKATLWQGMADWPRPDIAFEDRSTRSSIALEFKPPNQPKREYVTGLGQSLTYLNDFEFAGLIVPEVSNDGFAIAQYFCDMLRAGVLGKMPVALLAYRKQPSNLTVLQPLRDRVNGPNKLPAGIGAKVFWGYWRDLSSYDLLTFLTLVDRSKPKQFERVFDKFWTTQAVTGRARTWEGELRKKKQLNAPGRLGERINVWLAMRNAGLIDSSARITADGYELLSVGKIYGADSAAFLDTLARHVLTNGRHLDLILWVEDQQRFIPDSKKKDAESFYVTLDKRLIREGIIAPPPPNAAKQHFLRDEPKLWNKLGLLVHSGKDRYFHEKHGLVFDWRRIISILDGTK
jgi:hypothetical protein